MELFACVNERRGHTELTHGLEHDAVVCGVKGAFEVRVHAEDVFVSDFSALPHHDDGGEYVVDAARKSEAFLMFAEGAVSICVLGVCVFT
jgi:hypothetical protein